MNIFDQHSGGGSSRKLGQYALAEVIRSYLEFYAASSSHTARAKRIDLDQFMAFMARLTGVGQEKITVEAWSYSSVQRFVENCLRKGESPATVSRRLATLKHMGRTLAEKVSGFVNPARDVKAPQIQATRPKALAAGEIARIRAAGRERVEKRPSFIRSRNLMLLELMLETGLRAEEIRLLRVGQLDEKLEWITQVRTKGRRFRNVYISTEARKQLKRYLELRALELKRFFAALTIAQDKKLPLFPSTYKCDPKDPESFLMGSKTLWRSINQLCTEFSLHPHLLRHSFAIDLLDSSNDIRLVSQALGHSDVRVTMRYTERRDTEVAAAIERRKKR